MSVWHDLTIVTSCAGGYGTYLKRWAQSIVAQNTRPHRVVILTHGSDDDAMAGVKAAEMLNVVGIRTVNTHDQLRLDFGVARNRAVEWAETEWVMHFDCDDTLYPTAIEDFQRLSKNADVISAGYTLAGSHLSHTIQKRERLYGSAVGRAALDLSSMASGISPFRKSFWQQSPYRTDMRGAWDTALWIGFAKLGARFVPTTRPAFRYLQHDDSIFNQRRRVNGWTRALTTAQLKGLRRDYSGVAVIVPRDMKKNTEREPAFLRVKDHYATHHPEWQFVVGVCSSVQWIKGAAINAALTQTNAETLVIADADCIIDPKDLQRSVDAVRNGAPWSMPHHTVYRADRQFTERVCAESADIFPVLPFEDACERRHEGALGGGIVVIQRIAFEAIGGIPLAFQGWGSEDRALGTIANTLLGKVARFDGDLLHLWHPPQSHDKSESNLQVLRAIGAAAARGPDALASILSSLAHMVIPGVQRETQQRMRSEVPYNREARPRPGELQRRKAP